MRNGQIRGLQQHLEKRLRLLEEWKHKLERPRSGPRTTEAAAKQIEKLLEGQHLKQVLHIEYQAERKGSERLVYWVDEEARARLYNEVFGRRIVVTNRHDWSTQDILLAYRGQSNVEAVFRQIKDGDHLAMRPQCHWTDQKVQVHAFICLLGLLLSRTIERGARADGGWHGSLSGLLDTLAKVRLAMVLHSAGPKGGRPRADWLPETGHEKSMALFRKLVPNRPPFVYTDKTT